MSKVITNVPEHLLTLQPYVEVKLKKRENNNIPDIESLTVKQREVYDTIVQYLQGLLDASIRMIVLKGYAGTGKTYVITQVLKWYVMMMQNNIAITAPTNKAVKVLRQTANFEHSLIKYSTIHRLLGLKEKRDDLNGKLSFEKDWDASCDMDLMHSVIVDETSMLDDKLFAMIEKENDRIKSYDDNRTKTIGSDKSDIDQLLNATTTKFKSFQDNLKVVFLGDPIQIPPIGKNDCIPFNENNADEYGILTLHLDEIIRQKEGNPILDIATIIRENYRSPQLPYSRETVHNDIGSAVFINSNDKAVLYRICELYFDSDQFRADSDFMKVIAWTNNTVDFMNNKIRTYLHKELYNKMLMESLITAETAAGHALDEYQTITIKKNVKLPRILVGEKLIANSPIIEEMGYKKLVHFSTNDEFEVVSFNIEDREVFDNYRVSVYKTKVSYVDYASQKVMNKTIDILHENSVKTYDEILATLKNRAINANPELRGQQWKFYFSMKEKFADVKYNYAITAHKAQGSTYDNTIVIAVDITKNQKVEERNRILYVAVTRAKTNLFIVE
jgi:superfamily I DNA/RNA helicase